MANMQDIADILNISLGTVSKGLNNRPDISDELRKQILDTAVEIGYINRKALKKENRALAIFVSNLLYENREDFGYDIVMGFRKAAAAENWRVDLIPLSEEFQREHPYDAFMMSEKYSGGYHLGLSLADPWMEQFSTTTVPTILLDNYVPRNPKVASIGTDSREGIDSAIRFLVSKGHKKIAFLNGSYGSTISDERMRAYLYSMTSQGLTLDPEIAVYGYFVAETAKYHVPGFLSRGVTAILCGDDDIACGVYECCRALGYSVPEDVSVIGFDDIPIAARLQPALTTIRQDRTELGKSAYYSLYSMTNQVPVCKTLLRPDLIVRESVGDARLRRAKKAPPDPDSVSKRNPDLWRFFSFNQK